MFTKRDDKVPKSAPLPSIFSNLRNAGRATLNDSTNDLRPLMNESSTTMTTSSTATMPTNMSTGTSSIHSPQSKSSSYPQFLRRISMFSRSNQDRSRFRRTTGLRNPLRSNSNGRPGRFAVHVPDRLVVYTMLIFFIFPLYFGLYFLVRQVVFGKVKEDEYHPLHKKKPHLRHPGTGGDNMMGVMGPVTVTFKNTSEEELLINNDIGIIDTTVILMDHQNSTSTTDTTTTTTTTIDNINTNPNAIAIAIPSLDDDTLLLKNTTEPSNNNSTTTDSLTKVINIIKTAEESDSTTNQIPITDDGGITSEANAKTTNSNSTEVVHVLP